MKFYHIFLILILVSCNREKSNFIVEGEVKDTKNIYIYLYKRSLSGTLPVDSAIIDNNGKFKLKGFTLQPNFYILFINKTQYINLLINPGDKIKVLTGVDNFNRDYFIEGSKDSRLILKLVTQQARTLDRITELSIEYEDNLNNPEFPAIKARIDSIYEKIVNEHKKFSIEFIRENTGSLVSLMALYQQLGRKEPVFDSKKDFRYFEMVDSALFVKYPNSEAVIDLNRKVTEIRESLKVEVGKPAPALSLSDINGKPVSLSSLRGKVVLLSFWALWSDASLQETKYLHDIYKKFEPKGFEIYQVSLDRTRNSWLQAIDSLKPSWIQVSDLAYWDSQAVKAYRIERLPANFLIDRKGIIIGKNLMHEELEEKLNLIFQ
jgi:peroxiredoxin